MEVYSDGCDWVTSLIWKSVYIGLCVVWGIGCCVKNQNVGADFLYENDKIWKKNCWENLSYYSIFVFYEKSEGFGRVYIIIMPLEIELNRGNSKDLR